MESSEWLIIKKPMNHQHSISYRKNLPMQIPGRYIPSEHSIFRSSVKPSDLVQENILRFRFILFSAAGTNLPHSRTHIPPYTMPQHIPCIYSLNTI